MKARSIPSQRPADARLLVVDAHAHFRETPRNELIQQLHPGDLLVANDAATLPASLLGIHERSGAVIEIRLAGRRSLAVDDVREFVAIAFGAGDYRIPTEDRPPPPPLLPGDLLRLGPLKASILRLDRHPRLIALRFAGTPDEIWAGIATHGRPIQYAHLPEPLVLWDAWTRVAALPTAFEPPSAGFLLDWKLLRALEDGGVGFVTLTHAAGISSTGDPLLDARLPFDEPYYLPVTTVRAILETKAHGGRVIALGTSTARALEHATMESGTVRAGHGLATQRIGSETELRVVDAIVTGAHQRGTSHYELLGAFASDAILGRMSDTLEQNGFQTHEFGDSVLLARQRQRADLRMLVLAEPIAA